MELFGGIFMYMAALDMGISDFAVMAAIKMLENQKTTSHRDIAALIGCSTRTIDRIMPRLIRAGIVTRNGSKRSGYNLRVTNND
jgi:predicted transcriptional regulator